MKIKIKVIFHVLFFLIIIKTNGQEKGLAKFSEVLCDCIGSNDGKRDEILKNCIINSSKENSDIKEFAQKVISPNGSINQDYLEKINISLSTSCDRYNLMLMESFIDKNKKFPKLITSIGDNVCSEVKKMDNIDDKKVMNLMIPYLKKNQDKLLNLFKSPNEVVKNINNYLALNCKEYRTYLSISSAKQGF